MAKLKGAQRMVLQAILDLRKDNASYVTDTQIAQRTLIAITDVRHWIETLEGEGYVEVARTGAGLIASITAEGTLAYSQFLPFVGNSSPAAPTGATDTQSINSPAPHPTHRPTQSPLTESNPFGLESNAVNSQHRSDKDLSDADFQATRIIGRTPD